MQDEKKEAQGAKEKTEFIAKIDTFFDGLMKDAGYNERKHGQKIKKGEEHKKGYFMLAFDLTGTKEQGSGFASVAAGDDDLVAMFLTMFKKNPELLPLFEGIIEEAKFRKNPLEALFNMMREDSPKTRRRDPIAEMLEQLADDCDCPACRERKRKAN